MKKIFKTALVLICILSMMFTLSTAFASVYSGSCGSNLTWNFNSVSGTLTISGSGIMTDYSTEDHAPWFQYRDAIKIISVGGQVRTIGDYAFYYCKNLTHIYGGAILGEIGDYAFSRSGIEAFSANSNLRLIGIGAFSYCENLADVNTNSVTVISDSAFAHCDALETVAFSNGLVEIGDYAFNCCEALKSIELTSSSVTIGNYAFTRTGITSAVLTGATKIGNGAFYHCTDLANVLIPDSAAEIGDRAFTSCKNLKGITFEGDAPRVTEADSNDRSFDPDIVLYYSADASGWAYPTWEGYETVISNLIGDINSDGVISNVDLVTLARYVVGLEKLTDAQLISADMNEDGEVSNSDLVEIARYIVSL